MAQAIFRFAPSPNGRLHLGHAYSAMLNQKLARQVKGKLLLRIEDIDLVRCTPELERHMLDDLVWLGFEFDGEPRRQSDHLEIYENAIKELDNRGLVYKAHLSRSELRDIVRKSEVLGIKWPHDPDGAPHYPSRERKSDPQIIQDLRTEKREYARRLHLEAALHELRLPLFWQEMNQNDNLPVLSEHISEYSSIKAESEAWGDIILSGKAAPASYHLASVVDDALQGVTHVVRGQDLYWSTSIHRVLQELLGFAAPLYCHHRLIVDQAGRKLSKSQKDISLADLRAQGAAPKDILEMIGI